MDLLVSDVRLARFCDAVREKDRWFFKIQELGEKWAVEAKLIHPGLEVDKRVVDTLWELNAEAERIRVLDHEIRFHSPSLSTREIDFTRIESDVRASVKLARTSQIALRPHNPRDTVGIFVSDGLVPPSLHQELVRELDNLAAIEPKDFHPGTLGKVQDLIHPSLYPYIATVSPVKPGTRLPRFESGKFGTSVSFYQESIDHSSKYAWVPSIFTVSEDRTTVKIDSYINGLGPRERYPNLYRLLEQVFLIALPHLEKTRETEFERGETPSFKRWHDRWEKREGTSKEDWEALLARQAKEKEREELEQKEAEAAEADQLNEEFAGLQIPVDPSDPGLATTLLGSQYKVIVKVCIPSFSPQAPSDIKDQAANYILKPGQFYNGTWHLEGMPHERIVASFIYYYDTNEFVRDDGLSFRRARHEENDFPGLMDYNHESFAVKFFEPGTDEIDWEAEDRDYPSDWDDTNQYIPLGTVPTTFANGAPAAPGHNTGRIISFPNWVQHQVKGLRHSSSSSDANLPPAVRKILCFFLVDDTDTSDEIEYPEMTYQGLEGMHVLTTADVPPQNCGTNIPTLRILLPRICELRTGKTLPPELVEIILSQDLGLTREMAEMHRRGFMEDRRIKVTKEHDIFENEYSLCEH
ncbi:hypothetical protein ONZ45_g7083 [Pleurotus djamor]|nr:hypothetical protein ONZ45_g7083 [Pleurotus djamor]